MTDEEFVFHQTSRERKRNGVGTFHKKRQGGKYVRFPSDNMSAKEKRKMNGGVKVYNFAKPMSWNDFKVAPDDIKKQYVDTLIEKFDGIPGSVIAESFGVDVNTFNGYISKRGISLGRGRGKRCRAKTFYQSEDGKAWKRWIAGESVKVKENLVEESADEEPAVELAVDDSCDVKAEPVVGDISKVVEFLTGLVGTGAKVTIEFVL